jgi:hypothetical protein
MSAFAARRCLSHKVEVSGRRGVQLDSWSDLRATVHGRGRRRQPAQGVHRTAPRALDVGQNGDAVALFMSHVGMPAQAVAGIRAKPGWASWRRSPRRSLTTTRCSATGACHVTSLRRPPFRRWSSPVGTAPRGFSRRRRPPRMRCPPQNTGRSAARRTTWPRKRSHPCWSSSSLTLNKAIGTGDARQESRAAWIGSDG